jgi:tetratricopeptide (TPR) repeat protein
MVQAVKSISSAIILTIIFAAQVWAADWDRAVKLYNKGEYRSALAEFQDIVLERPDAAGAWYYIGLCEFKLNRYDRVELPLNRAVDLLGIQSPQSEEIAGAWYTIGLAYYLRSDYAKAVEPLNRYIELVTKAKREIDPSARAALGRSYFALERYDEALPLLSSESAATKKPKAGATTEAIAPTEKSKDAAANAYYVGVIHFKREDDDRAIPAFREAVKSNPEDATAMELLAESLMRKARKSNSEAHWTEAAQVSEQLRSVRDDLKTANIMGRAYLGGKQFEKAVAPLEKLAKSEPENGQGWLFYGIALSRSGQLRKAMEALEITIQLLPESIPALSELAYVYESDKQYQQALRIYEKAYALTNDASIKESIERVRTLASQP